MAAVRLGRQAARRWAQDVLVLCVVGLVSVPGRDPVWDQTMGTLVACLDATLRRIGGAPAYLLGDNAKTVTVEHAAGVAVRHPTVVAAGRHYGATVHSCEPLDPESKGGVEATVRIAKADLVPTETNLRGESAPHRSTGWRWSGPGCTGCRLSRT